MRSKYNTLEKCLRYFLGRFPRIAMLAIGLGVLWSGRAPADVGTDSYDLKVRQTHFFGLPLVWVGDTSPTDAESRDLWEAMGGTNHERRADLAAGLDNFVNSHPQSPWSPAVENRLGTYCWDTGYFSEALHHWEKAWDGAKTLTDRKGRIEADKALIDRLQLLASLGRNDTMQALFDETKDRTLDRNAQESYVRLQMAHKHMLTHPEDSYRCGTYALSAVGKALTGTNYYSEIVHLASPERGFSMAELLEIAESNHLGLVAVERPSGDELVVPSVVHWKENHYGAIVAHAGDMFKVQDPTFRLSRWLTADAINHEAGGQFLVPAKEKPTGWRTMTKAEAAQTFGKGWPYTWESPPSPPGCGSGCGSSSSSSDGIRTNQLSTNKGRSTMRDRAPIPQCG